MKPFQPQIVPFYKVPLPSRRFVDAAEVIAAFKDPHSIRYDYWVTTEGEFRRDLNAKSLSIIGRNPKKASGRGRPSTKGHTIKATYALPAPTLEYLTAISAFINRPNNDVVEIAVALLYNKLNRPTHAKKTKK